MKQRDLEYAVIILNYNTINDAITAASKVNINSQSENYVICIADNNSQNEYDKQKLKELKMRNVITLQISCNHGYAKGNNEAILFLLEMYNPRFIVIMNPDVQVIEEGTIEKLIKEIDNAGENIVGGQPLVWNYHYSSHPESQINIRRVSNYYDECIQSLLLFKMIFRKQYKNFCYLDKTPYKHNITFESPSGAFFVINTNFFSKVNFFDENTFLYYEEIILGFKTAQQGKKFLLVPACKVKHEHGKSTGHNRFTIDKKGFRYLTQSRIYYAKEYLGVGHIKILFLYLLAYVDFYIKKFICLSQKMLKGKRV